MSDKKDKEESAEQKKADANEALDALVAKMGPPHYDDHKYVEELEALREAVNA